MIRKNTLTLSAWFSMLMLFLSLVSWSAARANDSIQAHFSVTRVDSLIQANAFNPDFVVLDVRTLAEYNPAHLEAAINRDFFDPGFNSMISLLPKNKMYVIYCGSGGRSSQTFSLMASLGFPSIVNMIGGISSWNAANLPTTAAVAPLLMAVSDTIIPSDTLYIGTSDSLVLTVTNRANDTLRFLSITALSGPEFSNDFDTATILSGPFDYSFHIIYLPTDTVSDTLDFQIESNGGTVHFCVVRAGKPLPLGIAGNPATESAIPCSAFPNPCLTSTTIEYELPHDSPVTLTFLNTRGQIIGVQNQQGKTGINRMMWEPADFPAGIYYCRITSMNSSNCLKVVKQ